MIAHLLKLESRLNKDENLIMLCHVFLKHMEIVLTLLSELTSFIPLLSFLFFLSFFSFCFFRS